MPQDFQVNDWDVVCQNDFLRLGLVLMIFMRYLLFFMNHYGVYLFDVFFYDCHGLMFRLCDSR